MDDITVLAQLLAVEVLLAEPELLGNDALEADLYILRDKLLGAGVQILGRSCARALPTPPTGNPRNSLDFADRT